MHLTYKNFGEDSARSKSFSENVIRIREKFSSTAGVNVYVKPQDQNKVVKIIYDEIKQDVEGISAAYAFCRKVFLPQGYPNSVSSDYFQYQFYDTVQAFCSKITGTIATKAVLKSVGVGDAQATPLAAAITWIFKDGLGMAGAIMFAWCKGTEFDSNCKKWRLFADVLNDGAMFLEILLPYFGQVLSLPLLCFTTAMRSAVGVAGSATRSAITQHQALRGNSADVAAKDGSQETAVNLVASIFGLLVLTFIQDGKLEWTIFFTFTFLHLLANYLAVSSLVFPTVNTTRLIIILRTYFRFDKVPNPQSVNRSESVLLGYGHNAKDFCGFDIVIGQSLENALGDLTYSEFINILDIYKTKYYVIIPNVERRILYVMIAIDQPDIIIAAYFHASVLGAAVNIIQQYHLEFLQKRTSLTTCLLKRLEKKIPKMDKFDTVEVLTHVNTFVDEEISQFLYDLEREGWHTDVHSILTDGWRLEGFAEDIKQ